MKRVLALVLMCAMVISLAACAKKFPPISIKEYDASSVVLNDQGADKEQKNDTVQGTADGGSVLANDSEFVFTRENMPAMNGSTSAVPMAQAVAAVLLGEDAGEVTDLTSFSKTTQSYRDLMGGWSKILFAGEPAQEVQDEASSNGFEFQMEPFAMEGLVFIVNANNPVDSLTTEQIQGIYSGKITNWKEVGGLDEQIAAFQRNEEAGSQTMMKKLVMKDIKMLDPEMIPAVGSMGGLIDTVRSFDGSAGAIGYSVYYYANNMNMADGLKLIAVDGIDPNPDNIRSGEYPFLNPYFVVIDKAEPDNSEARTLYNWVVSDAGQYLAEQMGYVAARECEKPASENVRAFWNLIPKTEKLTGIYTRLGGEPHDEFIPGNDYGEIRPFAGPVIWNNYIETKRQYGIVDAGNRVIVEPVYDYAERITAYDTPSHDWIDTPFIQLKRGGDEDFSRIQIAGADGSFITPVYDCLIASNLDHVVLCDYKKHNMDVYNKEGKKISTMKYPENAVKPSEYDPSVFAEIMFNKYLLLNFADEDQDYDLFTNLYDLKSGELLEENCAFNAAGYDPESDKYKRMCFNDGTMGVIDGNLNVVLDTDYSFIDEFHNGKAITSDWNGMHNVIDYQGNVLYTARGYFDYIAGEDGDGVYIDYSYPENSSGAIVQVLQVLDSDLDPLPIADSGEYVIYTFSNIARLVNDGLDIYKGSKCIHVNVDDAEAVEYVYCDDGLIRLCYGESEDYKHVFFDYNGNEIKFSRPYEYLSYLPVDGKVFYSAYYKDKLDLLDSNFNLVGRYDTVSTLDDKLYVVEDTYCGFIDPETMEFTFRYLYINGDI